MYESGRCMYVQSVTCYLLLTIISNTLGSKHRAKVETQRAITALEFQPSFHSVMLTPLSIFGSRFHSLQTIRGLSECGPCG
ncbi:hypothetical protein Plhal304r1_c030g0097321 [Plasmopara halstedii]